ncbi:MAG: hypothetical protein RR517_33630, partial [Pseudomonas sp.]
MPTHQPILGRNLPRELAERHSFAPKAPISGLLRFFSEPWFGFCIFLVSACASSPRLAPKEVLMTISDALHRLLLDNLTTAT